MAATATLPVSSSPARNHLVPSELRSASVLVTVLTMLSLIVQGYHPYAEDGGLYMAGIKRLLDPALYPHGTAFVTEHLRFSLFAPMVAELVRVSHMSLPVVLLLLHLASFWLVLFAAYLLAAKCYSSPVMRVGAVSLLAVWITLPIAGTSLMLMDPYVTARSFSTPCVLFALAGMLEFLLPGTAPSERRRGLIVCFVALAFAAAMHPLMAAYGFGCVLVLGCMLSPVRWLRVWGTTALCLIALGVATAMQMLAPPENALYQRVAMTRYYWFPGAWHWYEQFGLAAPLIILAIVGFGWRREKEAAARVALARMAVLCGSVAVVVAVLFARQQLSAHIIARLQPLRIFQIVYIVMILTVGSALAEYVLQRRPLRWITTFALLAGVMLFTERRTFPSSAHLELPKTTSQNQWEQAFVWIRQNTPTTALFALDAHYITAPGEDAQSFRAIAERSALPDYSKDGGEASITPELTSAWEIGEEAQTAIDIESDSQRIATLKPLGVTWIVLKQSAETSFTCAYTNEAVKVCALP